MKITSVDVLSLKSEGAPFPGALWQPTVVRVNTDDGISGFGEVGFAFSSARRSSISAALDFAPLVIGMDPFHGEAIWERIFRDSFWGIGGGGFEFGGISAIDIALWDIRGKALGVPVYQLLGGKTNPRIRAYASQLQLDWAGEGCPLKVPAEYAEATRKAMSEGFTAVKVNPLYFDDAGRKVATRLKGMLEHHHLELGLQRIAAMREAGGADLDIILELHALTDVNTATQFLREAAPLRILYAEEPTLPINPSGMSLIARHVPIPLSGGERVYGRWGFRPYFENGSLRVVQPDLGNCGGITEGKKIADMAHIYDVAVQAHLCGGPIAIAAALQLEAVIPNVLIHEHHAVATFAPNIDLGVNDYQPVGGYIEVPHSPGIGQELTESAVRNAEIATVS